ncbi:MAG: phosphate signaling complex protein PhoU [Gammaproteobacteria bacterium]|nr:phosphate signaling complex protein PhoU [Gammaproteobacteria bacterium]
MNPHPHISEQFDSELDQARNLLMEMGGMVEQQLHAACQALTNHDAELAENVKESDMKVNQLEIDLDELCIQIIARRQPAATDLRTLISIMKASTDLERIGDESERIAKMALAIVHLEYPRDQYNDIRKLGELAAAMVSGALDAFARLDAERAMNIIRADNEVDDGYDAIVRERGSNMTDPENIERALHVIWAARALERIGDHAKNISEYVVFLVQGKDIRHDNMGSQ